MAVFGGYETVRRLYRSGLASSYTARKAGKGGAESFLVKCYQPGPDAADEGTRRQQEAFLDGARTQQEAVAGGGRHWAAIHEIGTAADGVFCVGDYHRRSAQDLIRGKVHLDGQRLHGLVSGVVQGLIEVRRACSRPHGNLKPTNVLLTGSGDISQAAVLLSDPAGAAAIDPKAGDVPDMHAVGRLIYRLVLHREGDARGGWNALPGKPWQALGKRGEQWRDFCNRLLDPNLTPGLLTFDDLAEDLTKLREGGGVLSAKVLVPVVLLLLAAGVVAGYLTLFRDRTGGPGPEVVFDDRAWRDLCTHWEWVGPLTVAWSREDEDIEPWKQDAYLNQHAVPLIAAIHKEKERYSPFKIAEVSWRKGRLKEIRGTVPDKAKTTDGIHRIAEALEKINDLKDVLLDDRFVARNRLKEAIKAYPQRGWDAPARYLQAILPVFDAQLWARVNTALHIAPDLKEIDGKWRDVRKAQGAVSKWKKDAKGDLKKAVGDPNAPRQPAENYVTLETRATAGALGEKPLKELREKLEDILASGAPLPGLRDYIESDASKRVDETYLNVKRPFRLAEGTKVTDAILRNWLQELKAGKYDRKPDPRTIPWERGVEQAIKDIGGRLADLDANAQAILKDENLLKIKEEAVRKKYQQDANSIGQGVAAKRENELKALSSDFENVKAPKAGAYTYETHDRIDDGMEKVRSGRQKLEEWLSGADRTIAAVRKGLSEYYKKDLAQYIASQKARPSILKNKTGVPEIDRAVDQAWRDQRDKLIGAEKTVEALSAKIERLEAKLLSVVGQFDPNLPAGFDTNRRTWNEQVLTTGLQARRKDGVQGVLISLGGHWPTVLAGQPLPPAAQAEIKKRVDDYNAWRRDLLAAVPAYNRVQDFLAAGCGLTEKPADSGETIEQVVAKLAGNQVLADRATAQALAATTARIAKLRQIGTMTDVAGLLAEANAGRRGQFEAARAAYFRLDRKDRPWPGSLAELRQEIGARKNLESAYGPAGGDARKKQLADELTAESRRRWESFFLARTRADEIDSAIGRMSDFGLDAASPGSLQVLTQYRIHLHALSQAVTAAKADDDVKTAAAAFIAKVRALGGNLPQRADVAKVLSDLAKALAAPGGGADFTKAGPAAAGWQAGAARGNTVAYTWPGKNETLTFVRVPLAGGQACYLGATEVPVGLFMKVVLDQGAQGSPWQEMNKLLRQYDPAAMVDPRRGPRTWVRSMAGTIERNAGSWLVVTPSVQAKDQFPGGQGPGRVTDAHPVQQVSLAAAICFARLLGCRLPTSAEWQAAYAGDQKRQHNLRDQTWAAQQKHAVGILDQGMTQPDEISPDASIFWPKDLPAGQRKQVREATVVNQDDGVLFFAPVDSETGRTLQHLAGNVAEFVFDTPDALAKLNPAAKDITDLLTSAGQAAAVIGGSALSAPEVPLDRPQKLDLDLAAEGFSDVGFRLAFLAGPEDLRSRVLRLLNEAPNQGYLQP